LRFGYLSDGYYLRGIGGGTTQVEIKASDGKLYAGGGLTIIDKDGISLIPQVKSTPGSDIKWGSKLKIGMFIDEKSTFADIHASDEVVILTNSAYSPGGTIPGATNRMIAAIGYNEIGFGLVVTNTDKYAAVYGGRLELDNGTVANPILTFNGDRDTGIYHPAADQIGITVGGGFDLLVTNTHIIAYDDLRVGGGLYVGSTSIDPYTDDIVADGFITSGKTTSVKVYRTSNKATTNNTWTVIDFDADFWDEIPTGLSEQHSTSSNNTRLTCRVAGKYLVFGEVIFASNASGNRSLVIRKNGAAIGVWETSITQLPNAGNWETNMQISTVLNLAVGDYVELCALQSSGGNLDIMYRNPESPVFGMIKIA